MQLFKDTELIKEEKGISDKELAEILEASLPGKNSLKRVLIVPPDTTRLHSGAGKITNIYYHMLEKTCEVDILPALGTHVAMKEEEYAKMFGDIPLSRFIVHNWRTDTVKIGEAPRVFVREISEGLLNEPISFEVNKRLLDPSYEIILSVGQVVPHEVAGMANYTKNLVVGCGGNSIINSSHILGAFYGLERLMGKDFSPVRKLFDYSEKNLLGDLPLCYILTVTTVDKEQVRLNGLFIGRDRKLFEHAVALSKKKNLTFTDTPYKKVVVFLDPGEFRSTWVGNKAIYRTRMAIADGGELIILAPGVERFGEDAEIDRLIRRYGYTGREHIIECCGKYDELKQNLSAAAHLIHGSSDGRFQITYCPGHLTGEEVRGVGFEYMPYDEAEKLYRPKELADGLNTANGEEIFYISNPAVGLWADRAKF